MSKPQPATEVPRSIDARHCATPAFALLMLLAPACLSPQGGEATSDVMLGSETGTTASASTSGDSSTQPAIMTTTDEPDTTDDPGPESTSSTSTTGTTGTTGTPDTTTGVPASCGNGSIEPGEDCDEGLENADEGTCTTACKSPACGDGFVQVGAGEVCDNKINDGSYGGCAPDCKGPGLHCGDGVVTDMIEACDGGDPWDVASGCLTTCQYAKSCKLIRENFPDDDTLVDGVYTIKPFNKPLVSVYCDMDADGGGYTFLKVALPEPQKMNAAEAEKKCGGFGMRLLATRTPMHVVASAIAAKSAQLEPVGGGTTKGTVEYLSILGIYPVIPGKSCAGMALRSADCPQWKTKGGPFFVTSVPLKPPNDNQPSTTNCAGCSMLYAWDQFDKLAGFEAFSAGGVGAASTLFMCDTGDKIGAP